MQHYEKRNAEQPIEHSLCLYTSTDKQANVEHAAAASCLLHCQAAVCSRLTFGLLNVGVGMCERAGQPLWPPSPAALSTCYSPRGG